MGPADEPPDAERPEIDRIREVVPARAVLTELARGFLLEHETNPARAIRFAETFVRECAGAQAPAREETPRPVTDARRNLGRASRGAIDPSNFPPVR